MAPTPGPTPAPSPTDGRVSATAASDAWHQGGGDRGGLACLPAAPASYWCRWMVGARAGNGSSAMWVSSCS
eukprot:2725944-Prymnesium_polylepis.1